MSLTLTTNNVLNGSGTSVSVITATDGTNQAPVHPVVNVTGALINPATSENQANEITALTAIQGSVAAGATAAGQSTGNTSLASLVAAIGTLPTGAATSALQGTGNTSLTTVAGNTGAAAVALTAALTVAGSTHVSGTVVGGLITLTGAARANAGAGIIQGVNINVTDGTIAPYDVLFFDTVPTTTFTDNTALALATADMPLCCGVAHCTDVVNVGSHTIVQAQNLAIPFKVSAANTNLYAVVVLRGSAAYTTANGVSVRADILQS